MSQKILATHAGVASVKAGDLINCRLDMVLANDITAPPAIAAFEKIGKPVFSIQTGSPWFRIISRRIKILNRQGWQKSSGILPESTISLIILK